METKQFYKSKTFWLNAITILIGIVQVVSKTYTIPTNTLLLINGVGNLLLKMIGGQPIAFGKISFAKKEKVADNN